MISRGTVVAFLLVVEVAIVGEAYTALRGDASVSRTEHAAPPGVQTVAASGSRLAEDGAHRLFSVGAQPAVTVRIGYADLTIVTGPAGQIDCGLRGSNDFGMFGSSGPVSADRDGDTVRVSKGRGHGFSMGDDRMVTLVVPPNTRVTVEDAGDITVTGLRAEAGITSVGSGSITVEDYEAPTLRVTAGNGKIVLRRVSTDHLDAVSKNDRVEGSGLRVRDGTIDSDDHVRLGFASGSDALVTAETNDGKIYANGLAPVSGGAAASVVKSDDDDSSASTVRLGDGTGRFDVHVHDGDITLTQGG
jgi:hypothetical protein